VVLTKCFSHKDEIFQKLKNLPFCHTEASFAEVPQGEYENDYDQDKELRLKNIYKKPEYKLS
jgi:hypothetical protein